MSRPDLDALLNVLLPFAQNMLAKHGEFYPYAATMTVEGKVTLVDSHDGDEHPTSQAVLDVLHAGLREQANTAEIRAVGVCFDVRVRAPGKLEKTDAVQVNLEHVDGEAVSVFLPYKKSIFGKLEYGDLFATPGTPSLFPS